MTAPRAFSWRAELARKGVHVASSVFPLTWAFGLVGQREVVAALTAGLAVSIVLERLRRRDSAIGRWFTAWFGGMLREHESTGLTGATWILGAMLLCAIALPERAAISALWAGVFGDAAAALVGRAAAARAAERGKTWPGSVACAFASAVGPWWLVAATPLAALGIGIAAMLAERPRFSLDDNARVAVAAGLAAWALGVA